MDEPKPPRVIHLKGGPFDGEVMTVPYGPVCISLDDEKYHKVSRNQRDERVFVHSSIWGRAV